MYLYLYEIAERNRNKTEYNKKRYDINTKVLITILRKINIDDLFLYGKLLVFLELHIVFCNLLYW